MPHVSVNDDPLLDRLIFGYDGTDYRVVKVDTSGNLVAALNAGSSITVTQATAADLNATVTLATDQNVQARDYGWIGAAWRKNPLAFGISGQIVGNYSNLSAAVGSNDLNGGDVPAGEVWLLRQAGILNENTGIAYGSIRLSVGGTTLTIKEQAPMVADRWIFWEGDILLIEGDNLIGNFQGCILNDNLYLRYLAVRVDVDQ